MLNQLKVNTFLINNSNRILGLMLLLLHGFLIWDNQSNHLASYVNRAFFLCHYGLFLLWQPIWRSSDKLSKSAMLLLVGVGIASLFFINWWLTGLWLAILFGLLGGRIFSEENSNR